MSQQPHDEFEMQELTAFADGELSGPQARQVAARLGQDPAAGRWVLQQQQLRREIGHAMGGMTPPAPGDLHARVQALLAAAADPAPQPRPDRSASPEQRPTILARLFPSMVPVAIAAILLIAAIVSFQLQMGDRAATPAPSASAAAAVPIVNLASLNRFMSRHGRCADDPGLMAERSPDFPHSLQELSGKLADILGDCPDCSLDLSRLGYEFVGASRCGIPGSGSVHLLYRAQGDAGRGPALSLWLRKHDGSLPVEPGKLYTIDEEGDHGPLLIWRDDTTVYYLTGDLRPGVLNAADHLRQASR